MIIKYINYKLVSAFEKEFSLGLAQGKIGFCIFSFWLSRRGYKEYKQYAENSLDEVFRQINTVNSIDVTNGLAGIGLAINYLIEEKYVKGDTNIILHDIDDKIFKYLSFQKYYPNITILPTIQILFYLYVRLKDQKKSGEDEYLLQELTIQTINNIYQRIEPRFYEEPLPYTINYPLAQFIFVLSKLYELNFYNYRIIKLLEELGLKVLSTIPILHSNKLCLLWGMNTVLKQIKIKGWEHHADILKHEIDINLIINEEQRCRNIYFSNGLTGIYFLLQNLQSYYTQEEINQFCANIIKKIENSDVWDLIEEDPIYLTNNKGLLSGLSGVLFLLCIAKFKQI